jgi:hypothetical protein
VIQRFKVGDPVLVLPRFAHLFPTNAGVVMAVSPDPFRPMFNEYALKLNDETAANVFEFQLIEGGLEYQTFVASVTFDSDVHSGADQMRGPSTGRHIVFQTHSMDIDIKMRHDQNCISINGAILERSSPRLVAGAEVSLLRDNVALATAVTGKAGTFSFSSVPRGPLNIQILIRPNLSRIIGMFSA